MKYFIDNEYKEIVANHCYNRWYLASHGYWRCTACDMYLHHLILPNVPKLYVDHKDRNKSNCKRSNLRYVRPGHSAFNSTSKGKYLRGAAPKDTGYRWYAKIGFEGRQIYLGTANSELEAHKLYQVAALKYYGEHAPCNCSYCGGQAYNVDS